MDIQHRFIDTNGIRMHIAEAGSGPLVVLCHGFPECWVSWRAQLVALAQAGYHAVAPDMRGYGQTDAPAATEAYSIFHLVGDIVGLLDALGAAQAVVVGHDWGAPVAWHCALLRPDRFRAVVGMSVPFFPRAPRRPSLGWPETETHRFYQAYYCEEGAAEAEFERDVARTLRHAAYLWSGQAQDGSAQALTMVPKTGTMFADVSPHEPLGAWFREDDFPIYVQSFARGFRGPLSWYRNIDRNWELSAPWSGARIVQPSMYLVGERDLLLRFKGMDRVLAALPQVLSGLRRQSVLPGCGHWIQRERAAEVSQALLDFLKDLS